MTGQSEVEYYGISDEEWQLVGVEVGLSEQKYSDVVGWCRPTPVMKSSSASQIPFPIADCA
jgi:hypothetical protein